MKESLRKAHGTYMDHWRRLQPLRGRRVSAAEPRCGECRMARIHLRLGLVLEHGVNSDQASFPSARLLAIVLRILADPRLYTTFSRLQASVHVGCAASKLHLAVARFDFSVFSVTQVGDCGERQIFGNSFSIIDARQEH